MKTNEILTAIYNDKEVLNKVKKSVEEYSTNLRSMEQLKQDCKDIEKHIKDAYGLSATVFKKIAKATMIINDNTKEVVDEIETIQLIAEAIKK
ncbi:MAG: hypothetical protein E6Q33_02600 [Neisseriales bacterium]|nr:MAG: hypothetical protein E6Q33_02600 [Neisseriales bacterium]